MTLKALPWQPNNRTRACTTVFALRSPPCTASRSSQVTAGSEVTQTGECHSMRKLNEGGREKKMGRGVEEGAVGEGCYANSDTPTEDNDIHEHSIDEGGNLTLRCPRRETMTDSISDGIRETRNEHMTTRERCSTGSISSDVIRASTTVM
ncbi:hypothetical protein LSTR_LSTR003630 [Laodelphax striatellus]|uniref:Uncharacterized protein n=1 Tax=Laodelphax striatellus TaxID=195883 RepID=A0A482XAR4_LAOST|nr:hypothetical protein LSTR_LSTR003630 [Laodelphax striatellus]